MTTKTVAIIGAGLAGLTAAYRLTQRGIPCDIYEASSRVGGRAWTGVFRTGQVYELGGELIDSNHTSIINLCRELGLSLSEAIPRQGKETYLVIDYKQSGNPLVRYTMEEAFADYQRVFPRVQADAYAAWPSNQSFNPNNTKAKELDRLSIDEYVAQICAVLDPVKPEQTKFAQVLRVAYNIEYGEETSLQSALNLIFLMGYGDLNIFNWFGVSDEKYNIVGGTETLVRALQSRILNTRLGRIFLSSPLQALIRYPGNRGRYEVRTSTRTSVYDAVLMTPSFEAYANFDYSQAQFGPMKRYIINNCKLGNNSKLNIQFNNVLISNGYVSPWEQLGYNGATYATTDTIPEGQLQSTWDVAQDQQVSPYSVLCNYTGGNTALAVKSDFLLSVRDQERYLQNVVNSFLSKADLVYPGLSACFQLQKLDDSATPFNVRSINWAEQPWVKGAYTCYRIGQYCGGTGLLQSNSTVLPGTGDAKWNSIVPMATFEPLPEPDSLPTSARNCFFAGESTTLDWQGWLNGATQTGEDTAVAIANFLKN